MDRPFVYTCFFPHHQAQVQGNKRKKKNNHGLSGAYVTCIHCNLSVKINTHKTPNNVQRSGTHLYFVCFCKDPNLSPMADDAMTRSDTGGLDLPCVSMAKTSLLHAYIYTSWDWAYVCVLIAPSKCVLMPLPS